MKTITIHHLPLEESLTYIKLSEVPLVHGKGTTLHTKKEPCEATLGLGKKNEHPQQELGNP